MSFMFEVYYSAPEDKAREARLVADITAGGGRLDYREFADSVPGPICLTFEFDNREQAENVAAVLRSRGEHVEGVSSYG
jgi:hypothetical protein